MKYLTVLLVSLSMLTACSAGTADTTAVSEPVASTSASTVAVVPVTSSTVATTTTTTVPTTTTTAAPTTTASEVTTADVRQTVIDTIIPYLEGLGEVERVERVTWEFGTLEIEARLQWASEDRQMDSHWTVVTQLADLLETLKAANPNVDASLFSDDDIIRITSVATDGEYPITSNTPRSFIAEIYNRSAGREDWSAFVE